MGQHPAPQGPPGREARQAFHATDQGNHGRRAAWAAPTRRSIRGCGWRSTRRTTRTCPKDTIQNAIKRGTGDIEGANYEEIRYEGYGIGGAAVIVDCMTDNRTRTVADVRHAFTKYGGNLGTDGSVAFLFKHCGQLLFAPGTTRTR